MLKKSIKLFLAIVMIAGLTTTAMAQVTEETTAGAVIITPISIRETAPLHFGVMAVSGTPGTCVLSTLGVRSRTGGVNLSAHTPAATNAAYTVNGQASTTYALTLPATIVVTRSETLATMTISSLVARFNGAGSDAVISTLSEGGNDSFTVGGTLSVESTQTAGEYAGPFNVTVAYN